MFRVWLTALVIVCAAALGSCGSAGGRPSAIAADSTVLAPEDTLPPPDAAPAEPVDPRVEILWDTWGVPHVFAEDLIALFFGFGWAQMHSHGDLLLRLYGQARGRAAEYFGEAFVESDRWVRVNGVPARSREWLAQQSPYMRMYLEAFVAGLNAYARQNAGSIDDRVEVVLPIETADVLGHLQRVIHFTFLASPDAVRAGLRDLEAPPGSNAWAIAPARSASGNAMLLINPHLPWSDLFTWYETQLVAPGLDVYGAALVGFPLPGVAFNDSLGWTHTVNTMDGADLYELRLVEGGYAWNGEPRAFETEEQVMRVLQPDGTFRAERLVVRRSVHGPVVAQTESSALALRVVGLDQPHLLEQTWNMARARNLAEFETALARLQIPLFTVIYADRHGRILHAFNGRVPRRPRGNWAYWSGVVRGDTSATLWTETHGYRELPRVVDPASGWLQNANDAPWTTTLPFPLDPARYPEYLAPRPYMAFRPQRSARMLAEDERITFDELIVYKHSTRMEAADHILEDVVHAARTHGSDLARRAADVLERWDRQAEAASRGAVLFQAVMRELNRREWADGSPFDVGWTRIAPLATPDGISDPAVAAEALDAAASTLQSTYGALDVAWGDVHRLRRDSLDLPANGGPDPLGIFRATGFRADEDGRYIAVSGDSFVAAVEFATPVRARALIGYGNASQPGSPHRTDQLPLYADKQLRPVWRTRAEIESNLLRREAF